MAENPVILVVDDNEIQRGMMKARLLKKEYEVIEASSGSDALKIIDSSKIDLVLLDLNMPGIDGHEVLDEVRKTFTSIQLPIIMVTAEEDPDTIISSFEKGANDYILKQISFKIALQRINTQLKLKVLAEESAKSQKIEAINAMIVTYNHEINNPLAIAYGNLGSDFSKFDETKFNRTLQALERIKDLVAKIQTLDASDVEYSSYTSKSKMLKIS
ncbi:response regulator [Pseudobacteriovorax antillogorgiicola]|uniref:Response regulator receiver domain-containing protein n=1 Tax=Pseudobacteriovorax antillogorgiicola TaxID=1513793 RepID=A0A1Y6CTI6_9BACT|nr:response regulator [Pseudobacteriovorax antillogorgiicola]TCS44607.1 response regulator receiver domain-containing protein [Pseudobacteriovorax antillogorgiicola]SMF78236.1 Response regulator receiver domain-containing protein [Pseudobacteriovorax antillogorgiicola]